MQDIIKIRNFAIIAHIDAGKSTLADRFLETTKTIPIEKLQPQYLDRLSLERERGITIKMQPVRMLWKDYILNLIDTPGHIDFSYEVSRALAAVEGVILLIDGTQGIQAQTLAHLEIAKQLGLTIIPAINKIDLNPQNLDLLIDDISKIVEVEKDDDIFLVSAKTGEGVEKLLEAVIQKIPSPRESTSSPRESALIFDSHFDSYKGIVAHTRIFGGEFNAFQNLYLKSNNYEFKSVEVGIFSPDLKKTENLKDGEIGYIATGIKDPGIVKIGDTIVSDLKTPALTGYKEPQPVIFASVFPSEEIDFKYFKESIDKLRLNDPSIFIDLSYSPIFGRGYLIGCMGLLHLDIFQERLKREFGTEIIITLPSLKYEIIFNKGQRESASSQRESAYIQNAQELPPKDKILEIKEPWTNTEIFTPLVYIETIFNLIKNNRGVIKTQSVKGNFAVIEADIPLDELITGFFDDLKSISSGYASLTWEFLEYRAGDLVKLDILIAEETNPALSRIIIKNRVEIIARKILKELKELLSREQFPVKLQAVIEGKIIARETIPALKADVAGYLYGGDRTRKMKLWQKQKRGKKKLTKLGIGRVRVPNDVLIKILKVR